MGREIRVRIEEMKGARPCPSAQCKVWVIVLARL